MRILKLLNKKYFILLNIYFISINILFAEDKPIDIWDLKKKEVEIITEPNLSTDNIESKNQNSVYNLQSNKQLKSIKLEKEFSSKQIKIVGLYDPQDYGLTIDMWSNSDGLKLKKLFKNIANYKLSMDASEIMNISLLTNAYYPNKNITEKEFTKFKSDWLKKDSNFELIEEYLIKNQIIDLYPELTRYLVDNYLSNSNIKKSCEIFSKNTEPINDKYLSKFNRTVREVKDELENELKIAELHQHLRTAEKESTDKITPEIQASVESLKQAAQSVTRPFDQNLKTPSNKEQEKE